MVGGASNLASVRIFNLWKRLGAPNRAFLIAVANAFPSDQDFSLAEMATAAGTNKESVRARLMNIGRSIKSLGTDPQALWTITWQDEENSYRWDPAAREAILKLGEG